MITSSPSVGGLPLVHELLSLQRRSLCEGWSEREAGRERRKDGAKEKVIE